MGGSHSFSEHVVSLLRRRSKRYVHSVGLIQNATFRMEPRIEAMENGDNLENEESNWFFFENDGCW